MFELHPDFASTSIEVGDLPLSHLRLQDDARFPWLILIPRRVGARELEDLPEADRAALLDEVLRAGRAVRAAAAALGRPAEKLNIAQLGNVTPQLHVHVIGRRADDAAWPRPVWGVGAAEPWTPAAKTQVLTAVRGALA